MLHSIAKFALLVVLSLGTVSTLNADVIFNLSPAADGTTDVEIIGTGSVVAEGLGFSYISNSPLPFTGVLGNLNPSPTLNGLTFDLAIVGGNSLLFTFGGAQLVPMGTQLSELDGTYSTPTVFASLNPGPLPTQSLLTADFAIDGSGDLGPITLNVAAAVPEPSTGSILLLGSTLLAIVRRKRSCFSNT